MKAGQTKRESGQISGTQDRDTLARAHLSFGEDVPVVPRDNSGGTHSEQTGQVQPSAEATGRPGPFGAAVDCKEEHRRRFAADPRFAGWIAGSQS